MILMLKDWYHKKIGVVGPPTNISFFYKEKIKGTILFFLISTFWMLLQGFDGFSTLDGFNTGFKLGTPGIALGAVIIAIIALYPLLWQYLKYSNKVTKYMIVCIALIAHIISGVATSRYFMDKLGLGLDYNERSQLSEILIGTKKDLSKEILKIEKKIEEHKAYKKMFNAEKNNGEYSGRGSGLGKKARELRAKVEENANEILALEASYNNGIDLVKDFLNFNIWDKKNDISKIYSLYNDIPFRLRENVAEPKVILSPSHLEEAIRATIPWQVPGRSELLAWTGWCMSAFLEIFVYFLGQMQIKVGKQFRVRNQLLSFEPIALTAWSVAGEFIASRASYIHELNSHFQYQTDITTKILDLAQKIISVENVREHDFHEIQLDIKKIMEMHGQNTINEKITLPQAVDLFWWKSLPLLLSTRMVVHDQEKYYIKAAPFMNWVNVIISKRKAIGILTPEDNFESDVKVSLDEASITNKFKIHSDFYLKKVA